MASKLKDILGKFKGAGGSSPPMGPSGGALKSIIGLGLVVATGYYGATNGLFNVEGGHRAVMWNRVVGVREEVFNEGTHFMIPWFDKPVKYDVRVKPRTVASITGTRDLQMASIHLRVLSRPDTKYLPTIFSKIGLDWDERVLPSIVNEVLKTVVAQYNASQLITQREQVSRFIRDHLTERAQDFHILVEDVSITHLTFGKEYSAAVEAKQVAQQEAERAKFLVDKAQQEKLSTIIRAHGEAKSAALIGAAIEENPGFIELRRIEAAREIATTVANSKNRVFLNADNLLVNILASGEDMASILDKQKSAHIDTEQLLKDIDRRVQDQVGDQIKETTDEVAAASSLNRPLSSVLFK